MIVVEVNLHQIRNGNFWTQLGTQAACSAFTTILQLAQIKLIENVTREGEMDGASSVMMYSYLLFGMPSKIIRLYGGFGSTDRVVLYWVLVFGNTVFNKFIPRIAGLFVYQRHLLHKILKVDIQRNTQATNPSNTTEPASPDSEPNPVQDQDNNPSPRPPSSPITQPIAELAELPIDDGADDLGNLPTLTSKDFSIHRPEEAPRAVGLAELDSRLLSLRSIPNELDNETSTVRVQDGDAVSDLKSPRISGAVRPVLSRGNRTVSMGQLTMASHMTNRSRTTALNVLTTVRAPSSLRLTREAALEEDETSADKIAERPQASVTFKRETIRFGDDVGMQKRRDTISPHLTTTYSTSVATLDGSNAALNTAGKVVQRKRKLLKFDLELYSKFIEDQAAVDIVGIMFASAFVFIYNDELFGVSEDVFIHYGPLWRSLPIMALHIIVEIILCRLEKYFGFRVYDGKRLHIAYISSIGLTAISSGCWMAAGLYGFKILL
ncbi:hypothetical protein HDU96_010296 [Phlyctochytrium bullatum]|nr:hypothetical protein HDU96_010296 [Phlyctochytrium bullatum]